MSKSVAGPGPKAKRGGTPVKNGKSLQVVCYPRKGTKAQLVKYAALTNLSLSAFLLTSGLEKAAALHNAETSTLKHVTGEDLVPKEEYAELLRKRGGKGKRKRGGKGKRKRGGKGKRKRGGKASNENSAVCMPRDSLGCITLLGLPVE